MASFYGNHTNKIDRKGRVSVPARFRQGFAEEKCQDIILFKSMEANAIEACTQDYMDKLIRGLRRLEQNAEQKNAVSLSLFHSVTEASLDGEGRITLPTNLSEHASLSDTATFVGRGDYVQIWDPETLEKASAAAVEHVQSIGVSLADLVNLGEES